MKQEPEIPEPYELTLGEIIDEGSFGSCCECGREGPSVRNVVMLNRRGPEPGRGWGCVLCGSPPDGALAVLCDECFEKQRQGTGPANGPTNACVGYPSENRRIPVAQLPEGNFQHDYKKHLDEDQRHREIFGSDPVTG